MNQKLTGQMGTVCWLRQSKSWDDSRVNAEEIRLAVVQPSKMCSRRFRNLLKKAAGMQLVLTSEGTGSGVYQCWKMALSIAAAGFV